jgi:hypothetical protein
MNEPRTPAGRKSAVFEAAVGVAFPASLVSKTDYLIDAARFTSEGNWAFCRFEGDEVPALRLGFQRGGFNGGSMERDPNPAYLQLHLELMTREGAILWLPSGMYPAEHVVSHPSSMRIRLDHDGRNVLSLLGWPTIECHFCSADGDLQADLQFELGTVTTLPDCKLPHCLFGMWESMGDARGSVRYRKRTVEVKGKVFFDHTRVIPRRHALIPRHSYVYTTLYFDGGGGFFGYHSVDAEGWPIDDYCFGVYLDSQGNGRFLSHTVLTHLALDGEGVARSWQMAAHSQDFSLAAAICVQDSPILRCWGAPAAPQTRREFSIIPLVLDGSVGIVEAGRSRTESAHGLAEYFNADLWPADKAAMPLCLHRD